MMKQTTCYICDKPIEPEWLPEGEFTVCDECSSDTDKLSVEKLQEQNKTMKLALVELSDENIYDNTGFFANEYAKNLVEQLDAGEIETIVERCNRNLQEQLNTAKKALTEIYLDENETIIDPVFLFHQSQRISGRALNELGENNEI